MVSYTSALHRSDPSEFQLRSPVARDQFISKLVENCLVEIGITFLLFSVTAAFVVPTAISGFLLSTMSLLAVNLITKIAVGCLQCYKPNSKITRALQWIAPLQYAPLVDTTASLLIHEGGHALAASAFYKSAQPQIFVLPFKGGATWYNAGCLSALGRLVGESAASGLVALAGPLLAVSVATYIFAKAWKNRKTDSDVPKYGIAASWSCFVNHSIYALSALWVDPAKSIGHDFLKLRKIFGLHPVAAAVGILALPLIAIAGQAQQQKTHPVLLSWD